jgi:hypothetical protein
MVGSPAWFVSRQGAVTVTNSGGIVQARGSVPIREARPPGWDQIRAKGAFCRAGFRCLWPPEARFLRCQRKRASYRRVRPRRAGQCVVARVARGRAVIQMDHPTGDPLESCFPACPTGPSVHRMDQSTALRPLRLQSRRFERRMARSVDHPRRSGSGADRLLGEVPGTASLARCPDRLRPPRQGVQPAACLTSSAIRDSTFGVSLITANSVGHMSPSSRRASGWKPMVE